MKLNLEEKSFYEKLRFLSSIPSNNIYDTRKITESDLYEVCQYVQPYMLEKDKNNILKRISEYRDPSTGDTCLHIAAKSSNKKLVEYLLEKKVINADILNK